MSTSSREKDSDSSDRTIIKGCGLINTAPIVAGDDIIQRLESQRHEKDDDVYIHDDEPPIPTGGILGKVLSRTISSRSIDPGPPPDGGLLAWTQAIMAHLMVLNTWGYISSFGVFQSYYETSLGRPPSDISWIGSVQIWLIFFIGTFSGRLTDYGLFRPTYAVGSFFLLFGVFMTSISHKYWQLFLAQGICTGIGNGLLFCPCLALVSTYFTSHRAIALSIASSGTATGGIIFPIIVQQLLPKIGFGWTVRVIGFVMLAIQILTFTFLRTRLPPRRSGAMVEWSAFKEAPYLLFSIGIFLSFWGFYFAFYYLPSFGENILGLSRSTSINNLLVLNATGILGRALAAYFADRFFGPLNSIIPCSAITSLLLYCWAAVTSKAGLTVFAAIYGAFGSAVSTLAPVSIASLTTDLRKSGVRMGMVFSVVSFASLTGPPLAGALIQNEHGQFLGAQMFAATSMLLGCVILMTSRIAKLGFAKGRV